MKHAWTWLILFPLLAFGQEDTLKAGAAFDAFVSKNGYYLCYYPNAFLQTGRHLFGAGPVFTTLPDFYTDDVNRVRLTGVRGFYAIRPNPAGRRFTFYFRYDVSWQMYRNLFFKYTSNDNRLENYIGYGFDLNIGKRVFIRQYLGIGAQYIMRSYDGPDGTISSSNEWEEGLIGGVGVGCKFR